jgi:hypothetical protein
MKSPEEIISVVGTRGLSDIHENVKKGFKVIGCPEFQSDDVVALKPYPKTNMPSPICTLSQTLQPLLTHIIHTYSARTGMNACSRRGCFLTIVRQSIR